MVNVQGDFMLRIADVVLAITRPKRQHSVRTQPRHIVSAWNVRRDIQKQKSEIEGNKYDNFLITRPLIQCMHESGCMAPFLDSAIRCFLDPKTYECLSKLRTEKELEQIP